jgi:hypothetical protein
MRGIKVCEYQRINPDNENAPPMCTATGKFCTCCVLGNAKTYNEAKEKEERGNCNAYKTR